MKNQKNINDIAAKATEGDYEALERLLIEIKDLIFNLSLRMLGTIADAEDASQEVLIKIITRLSSFKMDSKFETWVYRITTNYLIDYKKSMFANHPLDFDYYANDITSHSDSSADSFLEDEERAVLADELKLSCTNVMLQCLTPLNRCIFILGTMFNMNSQWAGEILDLSASTYRKRLSRSCKKMQDFLLEHCEHAGGRCKCNRRIEYAIQCSRLDPQKLEYSSLPTLDKGILNHYKTTMEDMEDKADVFKNLPLYHSEIDGKEFLNDLLASKEVVKLLNFS